MSEAEEHTKVDLLNKFKRLIVFGCPGWLEELPSMENYL